MTLEAFVKDSMLTGAGYGPEISAYAGDLKSNRRDWRDLGRSEGLADRWPPSQHCPGFVSPVVFPAAGEARSVARTRSQAVWYATELALDGLRKFLTGR